MRHRFHSNYLIYRRLRKNIVETRLRVARVPAIHLPRIKGGHRVSPNGPVWTAVWSGPGCQALLIDRSGDLVRCLGLTGSEPTRRRYSIWFFISNYVFVPKMVVSHLNQSSQTSCSMSVRYIISKTELQDLFLCKFFVNLEYAAWHLIKPGLLANLVRTGPDYSVPSAVLDRTAGPGSWLRTGADRSKLFLCLVKLLYLVFRVGEKIIGKLHPYRESVKIRSP